QFPYLQWIVPAVVETLDLHLLAYIQPEFAEVDPVLLDQPLEARCLREELLILLGCAETVDGFDYSAIVPGAVKQHKFSGGRKMADIALEIPLTAFCFRRLRQRHLSGGARIHVSKDVLDRAALAGGIAPFEKRHETLACPLQPELQFHKFDLRVLELILVFFLIHLLVIWETA